MSGLRIAPDLILPVEAVTETFAIMAKRGKGKTNTAVVMVEEMIDAGLPVVVIDPVGVWWGLRSSADGKHEGLPVVIFGGDHADVGLEETAGELIADVIVDRRQSVVIDLSSFSKSAARRFMAPFLERLYHRNRDALHVVVDEADAFAPQRTQGDGARLLGAMEDLVRRGRARGIGCTLITQRPAVIHKDVLTQAEVLIALGMTGPRDVAAIDEWVKLHADEDQAVQVKKSLPSLPVGTAWVWSPGWLDVLAKVQIRARRTFDSSATPKPGQKRAKPQRLAPVDLDELGEQIAATVERAKADDPRELRRRIRDLEQQLATAQAEAAKTPEPVLELVHVPVVTAEVLSDFTAAAGPLSELLSSIGAELERLAHHDLQKDSQKAGNPGRPTTRNSAPRATSPSSNPGSVPGAGSAAHREKPSPRQPAGDAPRQGRSEAPSGTEVQLKAGARRILETLARHHPMRVTRAQLGTLAKFKVTGGTFQTYWSTLKRHGLVDENGGDVGITDAGLAHVGHVHLEPLTTDELLEQWRGALKAGARQMLDVLVDIYPRGLDRDELADQVGMTATGGTFQTYLSTLRRNGLATVDGGVVAASDSLFLGAAS